MEVTIEEVVSIVVPIASAAAMFGVLRTELKTLKEEVNRHRDKLHKLSNDIQGLPARAADLLEKSGIGTRKNRRKQRSDDDSF